MKRGVLVRDIEELLRGNTERRNLDFFANVPCPMKPAFKEAYEKMASEYYKESGEQFFSYVMTHCPAKSERLDKMIDVCASEGADELPEIFFSYALEDVANKRFKEKFIKKGVFETVIDNSSRQFINSETFYDRYNAVNVVALFSEVIMVDKARIGNLPIPQSIEDLLDPVYRNSISLPDAHGSIDGTLPLYIYKKYGKDGLDALEKNVFTSIPTLDAIKNAGNLSCEGAPIHIVSWMFANSNLKDRKAELIWPKDGALSEPIILFVKKGIDKKLMKIVEFIFSDAVSSMFASNYLPVTSPTVVNRLPENADFNWLGWEYIYENDMESLFDMITEKFQKYVSDNNE